MENLLKLSLIVILPLFVKSQSCSERENNVTIVCSHSVDKKYDIIGSLVTCKSNSTVVTVPGSSVSSVIHSNGSEIDNCNSIEALEITSSIIKFIPSGINASFPNLKALNIGYSGLLSINKEDLREFGESLELLKIVGNFITFIDADLLDYNPGLVAIYLYNNPIRHIAPAFFTNLRNFENASIVEFSPVDCMDRDFSILKGHDLTTFEWKNERCFNRTAGAATEFQRMLIEVHNKSLISSEECLAEKINTEINDRIDSLETNNQELIEGSISAMKNETLLIRKQMSRLSGDTNDLKNENLSLQKQLKTLAERLEEAIRIIILINNNVVA